MEIKENLELVDVNYENNGMKAVMTFLDHPNKTVHEVNWNMQSYKDGKYVADADKAAQVEGWAKQYFNCEFHELQSAIGTLCTVYIYDRFNSLWKSESVSKFTEDMVGQIYQTEVKNIKVDDIAIRIRYEIDGNTYETKHTFGKYIQSLKEWYEDPAKKARTWKMFEEKYGVPVEQAESLIGHPLMVEVKSAFGAYFGDIKKFPKKK